MNSCQQKYYTVLSTKERAMKTTEKVDGQRKGGHGDVRITKRDPRNASMLGRLNLSYFSPFVDQSSPN